MHPEIAEYDASIAERLRLLRDTVRGLDARALNARTTPDENSAWALTAHIIGNARAWILGIACGFDHARDRAGEFAAHGDDAAALLAEVERAADELSAALGALDYSRLDARITPSRELWGEGTPREISVRRAIIQVIEHASLHLGHVQQTIEYHRAGRT